MTCIAAVKRDGKVVIGGDSLLTTGSDKKKNVRKITKFPSFYVGFAGLYAIRHTLDTLAQDEEFCYSIKMESIDDARAFARKVFEGMEDDLGDDSKDDIEDTALLIATSTKIFEIDSHITCVEHDDYGAIGSGARPAKASLHVLEKYFPLTLPRESCMIALSSATELDILCDGPYYVYEVEDEPRPARPPKTATKAAKPRRVISGRRRNGNTKSSSESPKRRNQGRSK